MTSHVIHVDSSERDPELYPVAEDYTISLNVPIYSISSIKVISAKIDFLQPLVHSQNNKFKVDGVPVKLYPNNYTIDTLASNIFTAIYNTGYSNIDTVKADPFLNIIEFSNTLGSGDTFSLDFTGGGSVASVIGLPPGVLNPTAPASSIYTQVNLNGPTNLILRITTTNDDIYPTVYSNKDSLYVGRICTFRSASNPGVIEYSGATDPVVHTFTKGPEKYTDTLRIRWYQSIDNVIVPYSFAGGNYFMKLEIVATSDKLSTIDKETVDFELPPPTDIPSLAYPLRSKEMIYIYLIIAVIIIIGYIFIRRV